MSLNWDITKCADADALTTAKVLAAATKKLGDVDLIIAGTESSDGYTGTVPEQIAEVLGLPSITFAISRMSVSAGLNERAVAPPAARARFFSPVAAPKIWHSSTTAMACRGNVIRTARVRTGGKRVSR